MPLFRCEQCGCVENTAMSAYWWRKHKADSRALCSECDPEFGKWHGAFPKRPADGMLIDQSGHLWSQEQVDAGMLPLFYKIVGKVGDSE